MRFRWSAIPAALLFVAWLCVPPLHLAALDAESGLTGAAGVEIPEAPEAQAGPAQTAAPQNAGAAAQPAASQAADVSGTVTDVNGDLVPGATVVFDAPLGADRRTVEANDNGFFQVTDLKPAIPYRVTIRAKGFAEWTAPPLVLQPGQFFIFKDIQLKLPGAETSITVYSSTEQIAVEEVRLAEQQRLFGFIPNFYVVYDHNAVPLTAKLKFKLALRVSIDPVNFASAVFFAGMEQAANVPDFQQGLKGYGQRVGAIYTDGLTDLVIGGAILPSLLHQDPRYFYQGTGSASSRLWHAVSYPFVSKGDNGKWQPNYSTIGGDLASSAISNTYYPASQRGSALFAENFLIDTGERMVSTIFQEFVLRKFTRNAGQSQ